MVLSNKVALRWFEFIKTTTFSVAVISTSGSMSATLITFGAAPLKNLMILNQFIRNQGILCKLCEG